MDVKYDFKIRQGIVVIADEKTFREPDIDSRIVDLVEHVDPRVLRITTRLADGELDAQYYRSKSGWWRLINAARLARRLYGREGYARLCQC